MGPEEARLIGPQGEVSARLRVEAHRAGRWPGTHYVIRCGTIAIVRIMLCASAIQSTHV